MQTVYQLVSNAAIWVAILGFVSYYVQKLWENSSVNKAILAETERLLAVAKAHKDFWQECIDGETTGNHPLIPLSHVVFDKQVENVGVIKRARVEKIVRFYGYVDYINSFQGLREKYEATGNGNLFNEMYIKLLNTLVRDFGDLK